MSLPVKYSNKIRGEGRHERGSPVTFCHIFVIKSCQLRLILINIQRGQEILQTYNIAEVEYAFRFVRLSILFHSPTILIRSLISRDDSLRSDNRYCEIDIVSKQIETSLK